MSKPTPIDCDVIIAGGGLVGSSLAVALDLLQQQTQSKLKIALVEAVPLQSDAQVSYDERTIALTYSSKLIFEALGIWQGDVANQACPLKRIHISNRGHFGICNLDCKDIGTPALGYVCPTRTLGKALYQHIEKSSTIDVLCPATLTAAKQGKQFVKTTIKEGSDSHSITTKLLVIADGGRSTLLDDLGFKGSAQDYSAKALLSIVSVDRPHNHVAYERFTPAGPLALLPLNDQRYAAVWTETNEKTDSLLKLSDDEYLTELQDTFGFRAGFFSLPSARKAYPLKQSQLSHPTQARTIVLGNAAHTVHPVGGQGFNLGLRDIAAFAELCLENNKLIEDMGSTTLLDQYQRIRSADTQRVVKFTNGLFRSFSHPSASISFGRNAALSMIENSPLAKRLLLRRTMGLAKHQPKLARGKRLFSKAP